jgi:hypothetical protein
MSACASRSSSMRAVPSERAASDMVYLLVIIPSTKIHHPFARTEQPVLACSSVDLIV